jgi:signal transduction histidine kinase
MRSAAERDDEEPPAVLLLRQIIQGMTTETTELRENLARGDVKAATAATKKIETRQEQLRSVANEMGAEQAMFRVLASVGAQLDAFSHEMNALLSLADVIQKRINDLRARRSLTSEVRGQLSDVYRRTTDLRHAIERHALYLVDVAGIDARRRRVRANFSDRFDAAERLLKGAINRAGVSVTNAISHELRGPPMFPAEVVAIFTNLLSNAVKAAGKDGKIYAHGSTEGRETVIVVENTGVTVDVTDSDKWFEPFRSTTAKPDSVLGQGMGLGLTIVRSILDEYGASARFVKPTDGFATAIQMRFAAK